MTQRYITTWRKPAPDILDWDHYVSHSLEGVDRLIVNIRKLGVNQFHTYPIGDIMPDYSSEF